MTDITDRVTHEYAGFHYDMVIQNGVAVGAFPLIGQHKAAGKEKHRRAAVETYNQQLGAKRQHYAIDHTTLPPGMQMAFSYDGEWTYFHYKGITRVVAPSDDGNYRIAAHAHGPVYIDLEVGFATRNDAEKRAVEALVREFEAIGL